MPKDYWSTAETKHAVSRMAAVLVMAAGGKIRIPLSMIREADSYELSQHDGEYGFVTYRARRKGSGTAYLDVAEGEVVEPRPALDAPAPRLADDRESRDCSCGAFFNWECVCGARKPQEEDDA